MNRPLVFLQCGYMGHPVPRNLLAGPTLPVTVPKTPTMGPPSYSCDPPNHQRLQVSSLPHAISEPSPWYWSITERGTGTGPVGTSCPLPGKEGQSYLLLESLLSPLVHSIYPPTHSIFTDDHLLSCP